MLNFKFKIRIFKSSLIQTDFKYFFSIYDMENENQIIFDNDLDIYANHLEKLNEVFQVAL